MQCFHGKDAPEFVFVNLWVEIHEHCSIGMIDDWAHFVVSSKMANIFIIWLTKIQWVETLWKHFFFFNQSLLLSSLPQSRSHIVIESFSTTETRLHRCKATQRFTQDNLLLPVASDEPQDYFRRMLSQQQDEREEGH